MKKPDINEFPPTDSRTYMKWNKNIFEVDYKRYAQDLEKYIAYLES